MPVVAVVVAEVDVFFLLTGGVTATLRLAFLPVAALGAEASATVDLLLTALIMVSCSLCC